MYSSIGCKYSIGHYTIYFHIFSVQVCLLMASLLPTTVMLSCGILVRMLVLCSAQLTGPPAVQVHLAELESGFTLIEGWFPLMILLPLLLPSHIIEAVALYWFV